MGGGSGSGSVGDARLLQGVPPTRSNDPWRSDDIETLRNASWEFRTKNADKIRNLNLVKGQYISYWDLQGRSYFSVPGEWVDFEGLQIRVNANLGMETTNRERYALKWWLNANRPTMTYRRFFTLLMRMLKPGVWEDGWIPALWDVRQGDILPPVEPTGADVLVVNAAASTFASYWNRIEEQAERGRRTLYDNT